MALQHGDSDQPVANGNTLSIIGIGCGVLAVVVPILFGPPSLILGFLARRRQERLARTALVVGVVGILVGLVIGVILVLNRRNG